RGGAEPAKACTGRGGSDGEAPDRAVLESRGRQGPSPGGRSPGKLGGGPGTGSERQYHRPANRNSLFHAGPRRTVSEPGRLDRAGGRPQEDASARFRG